MNKVLRTMVLLIVLTLVLGSAPLQAQGEVNLAQAGSVTINFEDGSRVLCVTEPTADGWSGGLWIPAPSSPSPSVWASCNVPYTLDGIETIMFSPLADPATVIELECDEGFIPEDPQDMCRPNPS